MGPELGCTHPKLDIKGIQAKGSGKQVQTNFCRKKAGKIMIGSHEAVHNQYHTHVEVLLSLILNMLVLSFKND